MNVQSRDLTGDGFLGEVNYNRGHITLHRSIWGKVVTLIQVACAVFILAVVLGAMLHINIAQNVLNTLIAGEVDSPSNLIVEER